MSINKVILLGRLGGDPEVKYIPSGAAVCNLSVATSEQWTDKNGQKQEKTEWSRVIVWGKLGELCAQYLNKGRQVYVEGKLATRSWDDPNGQKRYMTEIVASNVQFLGDGQKGESSRPAQSAPQPSCEPPTESPFPADDIPF